MIKMKTQKEFRKRNYRKDKIRIEILFDVDKYNKLESLAVSNGLNIPNYIRMIVFSSLNKDKTA